MEVDFAFICDHAEITGKVNALGIGFDTIYANEMPTSHRHMSVVAQLSASVTEAGRKALSVHIIDEDGNPVESVDGELEVRSPESGTEARARIQVDFDNVEYKHYGAYSLHILIDGNEMHRIGFHIVAPRATG